MRIALVGVGGYGEVYGRALLDEAEVHQVRFVAAIDPRPAKSALWGALQQAGVSVYPDLGRFFETGAADLVIISAPIHLHAPLTIQALAHGAAVLCEKPLAGSWQDGLAMWRAAQKYERSVAIGYQWSFDPATQALKQDVQAGMFGSPRRLKALVLWPRSNSYYRRNDWAGRQRMPDGAWVLDSPVNNAAAHYLHHMLYVLGDRRATSALPCRLQAELYRANEIENYDAAALRIWTTDGVEILFYAAHPVLEEIGPWMEFQFEDAMITYRAGEYPSFVARFKDGRQKDYHGPAGGHTEKLWEVIAALRAGAPPACGIEAALSHLLCVHGAQQSSAIHPFPSSLKRIQDCNGDPLVWVEGLAQVFWKAFEGDLLPSETNLAGWTAPANEVKLPVNDLMQAKLADA